MLHPRRSLEECDSAVDEFTSDGEIKVRSQIWRGVGKPAQLRAIVRVSYDQMLFLFWCRWCSGIGTGSQVPPALTLRCSFDLA